VEGNKEVERDNARTRRNKRRQQKAAENQTAHLIATDNNQNNTEQVRNKLLLNIPETGLDHNSVPQKQTGTDTSTKATLEEPSLQQCSPTLAITDQSSLIHSPRPESPKHLSPKVPSTDHDSPEQPSTTSPSTEQPSTTSPSTEQPSTTSPSTEQPSPENHRAENKMIWAEEVERTQKNHTRDTKQQEPLPLVRRCPTCHMTHLPCDCSSTFWNCGYCDVGLSYYFRDKIR
jgi:hypothetical protein